MQTSPTPDAETSAPDPFPSQEAHAAPVASESVGHHRTRRRWWLWLLACALIGIAAYALLLRMGYETQLEEWQNRLSRGAIAAYHLLPYTKEETSQANKAAETSPSSQAKAAPGTRPAPPVPVVATAARQGNLGIYLTGLGSVTAFQTVTVRSRVDGQLVKVAYQEGQFVHHGDLLAAIDPRPFQVQLAQAEGQMAKDKAQLTNAKVDLERYKVLLAQDSVSQQQLETQKATVIQYEGVIKSDQAQIDQAKLLLSYSQITAPITGRIGLRLVDAGNMVHASDQNGLAVITQLQPITVIFNLPEDNLPLVLHKMRTEQHLVVDAYNRDLKQKLATGALLTIDNQIDQNTGTVRCKAVFDNEDNALFPNQFVNVRLLVETKQDTIIVPTAAIQRSPQATFVYVVKDDSTVEMRPVVPGPSEGDEVSIESGLAAGETVVTEGVDRLLQGTKVSLRTTGKTKGNL